MVNRYTSVLVFSFSTGVAAITVAQDSVLFFDIRDNVTAIASPVGNGGQLIDAPSTPYTNGQNPLPGSGNSANRFGSTAINAGRRGAGGVLRLNPVRLNNDHITANPNGSGSAWPNYDVDTNSATGNLWLYMSVNDDPSGTGDVISSLGVDVNISNGPNMVTPRNTINSIAFTMFNDATVAAEAGGSPSVPWNGVSNGASNLASPPSIAGAKAVRIPVTVGPVYAASLGLQPNGSLYRVGRLRVSAGARNCTQRTANAYLDNSTYAVKLSINNLHITRVFQSGGDGVETVSMGYDPFVANATFGTLDAAVNGSVAGTSAAPDAAIQIRLHGDFLGDGNVSNSDITGFFTAIDASRLGNQKQSQLYGGDFTNNRTITNADLAGFVSQLLLTGPASCP